MRLPASDTARVAVDVVLDRMMRGLRMDVIEPEAGAGPAIVDSAGVAGRDVQWVIRLPKPVPCGQRAVARGGGTGEPVARSGAALPPLHAAHARGPAHGNLAAFRGGAQGTIAADSVAGVAGASVWTRGLVAPAATSGVRSHAPGTR